MQLLIPDIKDNFRAKITRISLAIVPEWNPSWKSSAPEGGGTYWNFHPSLQILSLASGSLWGSWLQSAQDTAVALYSMTSVWINTILVLNLVFSWQSLVVSANWCLVWVPVCQMSSDRSRHQGGRGGRVFLPWIEHLDFLQVTLTPLGANRI